MQTKTAKNGTKYHTSRVSRKAYIHQSTSMLILLLMCVLLLGSTDAKEFDSKWIQRIGFDPVGIGNITENYLQTIKADPDNKVFYFYQYFFTDKGTATPIFVTLSQISIDDPSQSYMIMEKFVWAGNIMKAQAMQVFDQRRVIVTARNYGDGGVLSTPRIQIHFIDMEEQ